MLYTGTTMEICNFQFYENDNKHTVNLTCESAPNPDDIVHAVQHLDGAFRWNVTYIGMDSCNITKLSPKTFTFDTLKTVEYLDLSHNRITRLPENLFHSRALISLRKLIVHHNQISVLPDTLLYSPYLKFLSLIDLSFNKINHIPQKLFHNDALGNLESIYFNNNNIKTVQSDTIPNILESLYILDLSHNKISTISNLITDVLENCSPVHLCKLDLSYNNITVQDTYFIQNLRSERINGNLDLSYNRISKFQVVPSEQYMKILLVTVPLNPSWITTSGNQDFSVVNLVKAAMDIDINFVNQTKLAYIRRNVIFRLHILIKAFPYVYNCNCDMLKYMQFQKLDSFQKGLDEYQLYKYLLPILSPILKPKDLETSFNSLKCGSPKNLKGRYLESLNKTELQCKHSFCTNNKYCICTETPANDTLRINCTHLKMEDMPLIKHNFSKLEIYVGSNNIQEFPGDNVVTLYVIVLDLSHNTLKNIPGTIFQQYLKLRVLNVAGNQLVAIPAYDQWRMMQSLESLQLAGNEFPCTCSGLKLKGILTSLMARNIIKDINNIKCFSPLKMKDKVMYTLSDSTFGCPFINLVFALTLALSLVLFILAIIFVAYVFRYYISLFIFIHFGWRLFYAYTKNETLYDVFISYSSKDSDWVMDQLVNPLESLDPPYNLCLHERDFLIGVSINNNMEKAIKGSKCTLCVISKNWLESDWCQFEFRVAHCVATVEKKSRLLVILMEEIPENKMKGDLKYYMKTFTYLDSAHPLFWSRLLNDLPRPVVEKQEDENETRDIIELT